MTTHHIVAASALFVQHEQPKLSSGRAHFASDTQEAPPSPALDAIPDDSLMDWWNGLIDRWREFVDWIASLNSGEWSAIGAVGTLLVAVIAAIFAFVQVRDARTLRVEQARPYVATYLELGSEVDVTFIFLVVRNFGTTTARNIKVVSDKPMKRAWGNVQHPEDLLLFDSLPVLVPGQSWRTLFDWGPARFQAELDDTYTLTVSSQDSSGKKLPDETFVLDWTTFKPTRNVGVKTVHDIGKSVKAIEATLKKWTEGVHGLKVYSRDGDAKDQRDREDYEAQLRGIELDEQLSNAEKAAVPVIEEVRDQNSTSARFLFAGEEEDLPSYPEADESPDGSEDQGRGG